MNVKNSVCCQILICLCLLASCTGRKHKTGTDKGQPIELRYARLLSMYTGDGYTVAEILNPWDSAAVLHRYVLVPYDSEMPRELPQGDIVRTPLKRAAVYSSVHCGLADEFGAFNAVRGVCDLQYNNLQKVKDGVAQGTIVDLGSSMAPNIERIVELQPDAILLSPFENSGSYGKLGKLGIPIIECADYMETSPLGRAEWMRLYGMLFGREHEADSIFSATEQRYNSLKEQAKSQPERPTVVTEKKTGSTWYVAGARSYVGILIEDAGGDYVFKDVNTSGSVPQSPEKVFEKAQKADIWLIKYGQQNSLTLKDLGEEWPAYKHIKAFKDGNVYACNLTNTLFYENTPFHPDRLLAEYISIFHPNMPGERRAFYEKIK